MEDAPIVNLAGLNWHFESEERRERYYKWSDGLYIPFSMNNPGLHEYSRYQIVKKNPEYPENSDCSWELLQQDKAVLPGKNGK